MIRMLNNKGQSLVEVVLALGIFALVALVISTIFLDGLRVLIVSDQLSRATMLAQEGLDATRAIRDNKWSDIANGTHGLSSAGASWVFSGASDVVDEYTRSITVADVQRDVAGDIVSAAGVVDPRTKMVTATINWTARGATQSVIASSYLTNWNDFDWFETTDTEFGAGTFTDTAVTGVGANGSLILLISGGTYPASGTYESIIFNSDAATTIWENLFWDETLVANTDATIAVRTGNTVVPDGSWSPWSVEYIDPTGADISIQSGQYLQYRVTLTTLNNTVTPALNDIVTTYY